MNPLKPYAQKLFEGENEEYIEFMKEFGHDFTSKDDEYLIVNIPHDREQAFHLLDKHHQKYPEETVKLELSGIFEIPTNSNNGEVIKYDYESREITSTNYKYFTNIPIMIQLPQDLERVKLYIETVLHNYSVSESSVKLTIVSSIAFIVSRLVKVTGKIEHLPEEFVKSRLIIADNEDDKLCWYRFLAICLNPKLINPKKTITIKDRTKQAKRLLCDERGAPYKTQLTKEAKEVLDNFTETSVEEMKESAKMHKIT